MRYFANRHEQKHKCLPSLESNNDLVFEIKLINKTNNQKVIKMRNLNQLFLIIFLKT